MILDEFGKPTRGGNTLCTPDWLKQDVKRLADDWEADRRVRELRNSIALAEAAERDARFLVGQTIHVRLPKRFSEPARLQSTDQVSDTESSNA